MISSWGSFGEVGQGVLPHRWLQRHRAPVQSLRLRSLLRSAERAYLVEREFKEDPAFGRGPRLENPSPPQPQTDSLFAFAHRSRGVFKFRRTPQAGTAPSKTTRRLTHFPVLLARQVLRVVFNVRFDSWGLFINWDSDN